MGAWSGLWDDIGGSPYAILVNTKTSNANFRRSSIDRKLARLIRKQGAKRLRGVMAAVNGVVAGADVDVDHYRVTAQANPGSGPIGGGVVPIEQNELIADATVTHAEDVTQLDTILALSQTAAVVADSGGNGGGGSLTKAYPVG